MGWTLQTVDDLKPYNRLQMNAVIEPGDHGDSFLIPHNYWEFSCSIFLW
jgi:hypothetical protein